MTEPNDQAGAWRSRLAGRVQGLLEDARAARSAGDARSARSLLEAVLALDPDHAEAKRMLAGPASRRQMTLLFCDIIGSTALADSRDPEEITAMLGRYRSACAAAVDELDGHIDDHRGDGMLVLFGYPEVQEDDARRGVLCGLRMIERIKERLRADPLSAAVHVRISVHTDLVVVADGIAGSAANEAARLQELAPPDTVVISDATHALVWPWFEARSEGSHRLRGVSRPIEAFTVLRELPVQRGRQPGRAPTAFVNRVRELAELEWLQPLAGGAAPSGSERAGEGDPAGTDEVGDVTRAVYLTGPGGIGKSRLAAEAARRLGLTLLECSCSRLHGNISLHPFRGLLERTCGTDDDDTGTERLAKLRAALTRTGQPEDDLPFLATVLDIPLTLLSPPAEVEPDLLRQRALVAVAGLLQATAAEEGGLLFVDDLQWADQSTLDLLTLMLSAPGPSVVLTGRDGFEVPWPEASVRRLPVLPLPEPEVTRLIEQVATDLSADQIAELVERSDGVPLFAEELVQTVGTPGTRDPGQRPASYTAYDIPAALRDPLLARLSRPEVDLELAQLAAVVGREVDRDLLRHLVDDDALGFDARLRTLLDAGIIELYGPEVRFRHELIREVAYETQRRAVLQQRHSQVADALLTLDDGDSRRWRSEAAFHLERAGRVGEAVRTHLELAGADQIVGAHAEALSRLSQVLVLLDQLPAGVERDRTELSVRELRSYSAVLTAGYAAPQAAEDYPRCQELCETSVRDAEVLPYLIRTWTYYAFRGDLDQADEVSTVATQRAAAGGTAFPGTELSGFITFFRGDLATATGQLRALTTRSWAATDDTAPEGWTLPNDPMVAAYAHLGPLLWMTGDADGSLAVEQAGLTRAARFGYPQGPFSTLYVNCLQAMTRNAAGDYEGALTIATQLIGVAEHHGFAMWRLAGALQVMLSSVHLGDASVLPQLVGTAAAWHQLLAADAWTPYWLTAVGQAQQAAGRPDEARQSFDHALSIAEQTGSHLYTAETLRGRGEARLTLEEVDGRYDLDAAVATAERQGAVVFADRARAAQQRLVGA